MNVCMEFGEGGWGSTSIRLTVDGVSCPWVPYDQVIFWPNVEEPQFLGFSAYWGETERVLRVDTRPVEFRPVEFQLREPISIEEVTIEEVTPRPDEVV